MARGKKITNDRESKQLGKGLFNIHNIPVDEKYNQISVEANKGFAPILDRIYFQGAFGYTVGLSLPPNWAEGSTPFIAEGVEEVLVSGMTLHLPVAARIVGVGGLAMSETVMVADDGCEVLTSQERGFSVVPW